MTKIDEVKEALNEIITDTISPQNIRKGAQEISKLIEDNELSIEHRKSRATDLLEEMIGDQNMDTSTRTTLMTLTSLIESLNSVSDR